ncbi:DUF2637 domain-containing protein [Streptomyces anulatus]|uniref:DUF2637 domain-containing protein n=1 Tax=Streptomyces anulatus TaxID=1892 RepID=UPI0038665318|nr:DUF2637 domain-containing protein [Streptomyces anulatus]
MTRFHLDRSSKPPEPRSESGIPPLSGWERLGAGATAVGAVGVGILGFYASFDAVAQRAALWGFTDPWVLPVAIDSAIPVFSAAYLFLIRMGMPLGWVRFVPWALTLVTCALNVAAGESLWSKVAHGAMSLLWVVASEIAAHIYAVRIGAATNRRMDKIRSSRWFLDPWATWKLWRLMKLWELRSYDVVLRLEQDRVEYEARLRAKFGRRWRRKAPVEAMMPLWLAKTGIPLSETAPAGLAAAGIEPAAANAPALLPAPPAAPAPAPVAVPVAQAPAAAVPAAAPRQRRTVTVPVQQPPQPGQYALPPWNTQAELYEVIKVVLDNGRREVFDADGPLTGAKIAAVLGCSEGQGRKVRARLIKEYAAERDVLLPGASIDQAFAAFGQPLTAVSP